MHDRPIFQGQSNRGIILQGSIVQVAALAIFGNDILRGYSREKFWPASTVFKFCKAVRFVALSGEATKPTESLFAEDPMQWISRLRDEGTTVCASTASPATIRGSVIDYLSALSVAADDGSLRPSKRTYPTCGNPDGRS